MSKRAVIVGCSYAGADAPLVGTMKDTTKISKMIQELYEVPKENITVFREGGKWSKPVTGVNVRQALVDACAGSEAGDSILFYFAGYGTRLPLVAQNPEWAMVMADYDVISRADLNEIFAECPQGCAYTLVADASCTHALLPYPVANGADEKMRYVKTGGRFMSTKKFVEAFNATYPDAGMTKDTIAEAMAASLPDGTSKTIAELAGGGGGGGGGGRRHRGWRSAAAGPIGEGQEGDEEEEEAGGRSRRERGERRGRDDEDGDARRRNRKGRDDGEDEEGTEEDGEEDPALDGKPEEPEEEAPPEPMAAVKPPAEEKPAPEEEEAEEAEEEAAGDEAYSEDREWPLPVHEADESIRPNQGAVFSAGMFRSFVPDQEQGGAFTRALVAAVRAAKADPGAAISNGDLIAAIEATLGEGSFKMTPAFCGSEAKLARGFLEV